MATVTPGPPPIPYVDALRPRDSNAKPAIDPPPLVDDETSYRLGRRPALDGLRALAVLAVIAGHSLLPLSANAGTVGVTFFFVLSGFLITRMLMEEQAAHGRIGVRAFYGRRARRLVPALVVFLVVTGAAHQVSGISPWPVVACLFYVANLAMVAGTYMHLQQHMWSLSMEEQFYLLWPLVLGFMLHPRARKMLVPGLCGAILVCVVLRAVLTLRGVPSPRIMFGPDTRADAILVGALLAVLVPRIASRRWGPAACAGGVILIASFPLGAVGSWTLLPVALASAVVVGWAATAPGAPRQGPALWALSAGPLAALGRISYGVYLWHFPVGILLAVRLPHPVAALLTVAISTALAAASWRYVEKPFQRSRRPADERPAD